MVVMCDLSACFMQLIHIPTAAADNFPVQNPSRCQHQPDPSLQTAEQLGNIQLSSPQQLLMLQCCGRGAQQDFASFIVRSVRVLYSCVCFRLCYNGQTLPALHCPLMTPNDSVQEMKVQYLTQLHFKAQIRLSHSTLRQASFFFALPTSYCDTILKMYCKFLKSCSFQTPIFLVIQLAEGQFAVICDGGTETTEQQLLSIC